MMKLKKLLFISSALLLTLSIAGCAKGSDSSKSESGHKTVEILNDKGEGTGPAKSVIPILEKKSGLNVKYVNTTDLSAYQTNIQQSLQGGDAPALFSWWTGNQMKELVDNDLLEDLSDQWDSYVKAGVSDQIKEAVSVNGKVYGAPLNVIYNPVFYNKEMFAKYNLTEPKTLDEFMNVCETLKSHGEIPIGIGGTWQSFCWPQALMGSMNTQLYDDWTSGKVAFNDEQVKTIFYKWAEMIKKGYFSDVQQDQVKEFSSGKTAMMYNATNLLNALNNDYGMTSGEKMGSFVMPGVNATDKKTIFYEVAPLVVGKNSSNKADAKKVLKAYYSKDFQQEYADKTGMSSVTNINFKDPISKSIVKDAGDSDNYYLKLRYYGKFTPEVVNLSIDEYWKIAANPTKSQVDKSLDTIQAAWDKAKK